MPCLFAQRSGSLKCDNAHLPLTKKKVRETFFYKNRIAGTESRCLDPDRFLLGLFLLHQKESVFLKTHERMENRLALNFCPPLNPAEMCKCTFAVFKKKESKNFIGEAAENAKRFQLQFYCKPFLN